MTFKRDQLQPKKSSNAFIWTIDKLANKFVGSLIDAINLKGYYRSDQAELLPLIQVEPDEKTSHLDEIGYWSPKLRGYHQTWKMFRTKAHDVISGEEIRAYNPMLVVDVIRVIRVVDTQKTSWALVVIANEKYYSVDLMNALIVKEPGND